MWNGPLLYSHSNATYACCCDNFVPAKSRSPGALSALKDTCASLASWRSAPAGAFTKRLSLLLGECFLKWCPACRTCSRSKRKSFIARGVPTASANCSASKDQKFPTWIPIIDHDHVKSSRIWTHLVCNQFQLARSCTGLDDLAYYLGCPTTDLGCKFVCPWMFIWFLDGQASDVSTQTILEPLTVTPIHQKTIITEHVSNLCLSRIILKQRIPNNIKERRPTWNTESVAALSRTAWATKSWSTWTSVTFSPYGCQSQGQIPGSK